MRDAERPRVAAMASGVLQSELLQGGLVGAPTACDANCGSLSMAQRPGNG